MCKKKGCCEDVSMYFFADYDSTAPELAQIDLTGYLADIVFLYAPVSTNLFSHCPKYSKPINRPPPDLGMTGRVILQRKMVLNC